jgi:hypothetical protein
MRPTQDPGRVAGLIYLLLAVCAPYRNVYLPAALFVSGDAAATAGNIAAHELLFRLGIVSDLLSGVILIFLMLAFYRLFKDVDHYCAVLVVILGGVVPAAIYFVNVVNDAAALILVRGDAFLAVFAGPQREALALLFLRLHHQVVVGAQLLWGLWLFPLAALINKSRFLPRFLGVWVAINGLAYVLLCLLGFLWPRYEDRLAQLAMPALVGELALALWLVVAGTRRATRPATATGDRA